MVKLRLAAVLAAAALMAACGGGSGERAPQAGGPPSETAHVNLVITSDSPALRVEGRHDAVPGYLARSERALRARSAADRFRYETTLPRPGLYRLYAWWPQSVEGAGEAWVTVRDADGQTRVAVDQAHDGGRWNAIGLFRIEGQALSVVISSRSGARVVADAIRIEHAGNDPVALDIDTSGLPVANAFAAYEGELAAIGRPPLRWSIVEGALPEGMTFDADTGRLSGRPARTGSHEMTVVVRDAAGREGRKQVTLEVLEATDEPDVSAPAGRESPTAVTQGSGNANLLALLDTIPEGSWVQANLNFYSEVWTPADLRPLKGRSNPTPAKIIGAWSSFGWDPNRSELWIYGGGHANYNGNDMYRWRGSTQRWERASLPSEITEDDLSNIIAIDGPFNAPTSAHTYDNNIFLPIVDRFLTLGGAASGYGGAYKLQTSSTTSRNTGPYFFDPSLAHPNRVGGTTGSHVQRVAPHPEIVGGHMWHNRDLWGMLPAGTSLPASHVNGCTAYHQEGGRDVVYVGARSGSTALALYKYTVRDLGNPANDTFEQVGRYWNGTTDQTTCAYDPNQKVFLRTGTNSIPFLYWDLNTPGPSNKDVRMRPTDPTGEFDALLAGTTFRIRMCGMEFDPVRRNYLLWCGDGRTWRIKPPAGAPSPIGWTIEKERAPVGGTPNGTLDTGILGKWRYAPDLDAFVGLQDSVQGNVWFYKPVGWQRPGGGGANQPPTVALTSPADGQTFAAGEPIVLAASAGDPDGSVVRVDFYHGAVKIGEDSDGAPYQFVWTTAPVGTQAVSAMAIDNFGASTLSAEVNIGVEAGDVATVLLQQGRNGYGLTGDTFLSSYHPDSSFGLGTLLQDQRNRYSNLVRFAIFQREGGPVPDNAVIQSARLSIYKYSAYNMHYDLHPLLAHWSPASSTWNQRLPGVPWGSPGALLAGVDHGATPDAAADIGWDPGWLEFDVTAAVSRYAAGSAANNGWILFGTSGYLGGLKKFHTSEATVSQDLRPKLQVEYSLP